jgi:hypothetical protein
MPSEDRDDLPHRSTFLVFPLQILQLREESQLMRWPLAGGDVFDLVLKPGYLIASEDPSFQQDYHALATKGGLRVMVSYKSSYRSLEHGSLHHFATAIKNSPSLDDQ